MTEEEILNKLDELEELERFAKELYNKRDRLIEKVQKELEKVEEELRNEMGEGEQND